MRRIILYLLFVLTSVFVISCSDSDSGSFSPNPTGIVIQNDCQRDASEGNDYSHCSNVEATGELVISKDESGKFRLVTKIQLSQNAPLDIGGYFE